MRNTIKSFIILIMGLVLMLSGCSKSNNTENKIQENAKNLIDEKTENNTITENNTVIEKDTQTGENEKNTTTYTEGTKDDGEETVQAQKLCLDSDNGLDYYTKGTVTIEINGTKKKYTDYCRTGKFEDYVYEYHCVNDSVAAENYECINGCSDGKCFT